MNIDGREIGPHKPPYVVAEIGAGHCGSLDMALDLIRDARRANADAVKLQTYTADAMTFDSAADIFQIKEGPWAGHNLHELYAKASTPREWHKALFDEGKRLGMPVFSTPFSPEDVEFLETLGCPAYKVASCEIAHLELLEAIRETKKPVIVSTGMASDREVSQAGEALYGRQVAFLHCICGYPTPLRQANIWRVRELKARHPHRQIGYSDHTRGTDAAVLAVACGATLIEKHIGERESLDGGFAMNPLFFGGFATVVRDAWEAMQETPTSCDASTRSLRRSVFAAKTIRQGEPLLRESLAVIRPSGGCDPADLPDIIGKVASRDIMAQEPLTPDMFK